MFQCSSITWTNPLGTNHWYHMGPPGTLSKWHKNGKTFIQLYFPTDMRKTNSFENSKNERWTYNLSVVWPVGSHSVAVCAATWEEDWSWSCSGGALSISGHWRPTLCPLACPLLVSLACWLLTAGHATPPGSDTGAGSGSVCGTLGSALEKKWNKLPSLLRKESEGSAGELGPGALAGARGGCLSGRSDKEPASLSGTFAWVSPLLRPAPSSSSQPWNTYMGNEKEWVVELGGRQRNTGHPGKFPGTGLCRPHASRGTSREKWAVRSGYTRSFPLACLLQCRQPLILMCLWKQTVPLPLLSPPPKPAHNNVNSFSTGSHSKWASQ